MCLFLLEIFNYLSVDLWFTLDFKVFILRFFNFLQVLLRLNISIFSGDRWAWFQRLKSADS